MKVLSASEWLNEHKFVYTEGCDISGVMKAYAEYYHESTLKYDKLMGQWRTEWYAKYRLLDVDFETFCKMMDYPKNEHDEHLRGENTYPGSL